MSDIERPWGLGDDALDGVWSRLVDALASDPERLDRLIAEELTEKDRAQIAETLTPLLFAMPLRAYPSELRALRAGARLVISMRHFVSAESLPKPEKAASSALSIAKTHPVKGKGKSQGGHGDEPIGYLPASLTPAFEKYLRRTLSFEDAQTRREVTVSSGGRRRRVRVTLLAHGRGVLIRFLVRLASPAEQGL
ncbi:MAG: hypothetical protein KIS92_03295 [Planctomycetota bacterium]|nr:hypothetical protein [Planctomycetota bacterium]